MKCSTTLHRPPADNVGPNSWCRTCQRLMRVARQPVLPGAELIALGLTDDGYRARQQNENVPYVLDVEYWPEVRGF